MTSVEVSQRRGGCGEFSFRVVVTHGNASHSNASLVAPASHLRLSRRPRRFVGHIESYPGEA